VKLTVTVLMTTRRVTTGARSVVVEGDDVEFYERGRRHRAVSPAPVRNMGSGGSGECGAHRRCGLGFESCGWILS
jgi:hypothetical protein